MPVVVYKKTNGVAHDLQFKETPDKDDFVLIGIDVLPDIETLHDAEYLVQKYNDENNSSVKQTLAEIDLTSIRSLREWIVKQADAPQILIEKEAEAVAEREKLYTSSASRESKIL